MNHKQDVLAVIRETRTLSFPRWGDVAASHKNNNPQDVVTELDREIEKVLQRELVAIDPETGFVGEEYGGDRSAPSFWLVDPIDGTSHFIRGTPFCTTMVARIEDGVVVFAAIYDFIQDVMYHAERGKGAFADDAPIRVSERGMGEAKIIYESRIEERDNVDKYLTVRARVRTIELLSSGYEHTLVATGKIEGRVAYNSYGNDYDYAPGALLVKEAGGLVANIGLRTYDYANTNYIAANRAVYEGLTSGAGAPFPITS
jgi:fructose-1,6-bisphosphatase/inositol monophosphatase family enzyme